MKDVVLQKEEIVLACSSGAICATLDNVLDMIFAKDLSLEKAHKTGDDIAVSIIEYFAKILREDTSENRKFHNILKSYEQNTMVKNPVDYYTDDFSGGRYHHLYDFAHHPTPIGLLCSIILNVTGMGIGTHKDGSLEYVVNDDVKSEDIIRRVYNGTLGWVLHLISDIAGSSSTRSDDKNGTGIPGVFLATLKELSSLPIIRNIRGKNSDHYNFADACQKLFQGDTLGTQFDFRTELGIGVETKQYISVLLCEGIVSAFYSVRRLIDEIDKKAIDSIDKLTQIDIKSVISFDSAVCLRMRTISSLTFSSIDFSGAVAKAYIKGNGDKKDFTKILLTNINYFGFGRLLFSSTGEISLKIESIYKHYEPLICEAKEIALSKIDSDVIDFYDKSISTYGAIAGIGTPVGFISAAIGVYKEISESVEEYNIAKEKRIKIEEECSEAIEMLNEYHEEMEIVVSEYMIERLMVFGESLDKMDEALINDDTDSFIEGNNQIQNKLGRESQFSSMDDFDALMSSDDSFKL